mmetsp:Transcript_19879/g.37408  ORF Transcript_19879/g.37408 Transcript_19879/m.37408 type:complete len:102 (+) Transcript_19879:54-359(+)
MASKKEDASKGEGAKSNQNQTTSSSSDAKRSRFGQADDPLDAFMANLEDEVKGDMASIGKKKPQAEKDDKHAAGAAKGAIQHQLKQRYRAKLNQMRGPRSD